MASTRLIVSLVVLAVILVGLGVYIQRASQAPPAATTTPTTTQAPTTYPTVTTTTMLTTTTTTPTTTTPTTTTVQLQPVRLFISTTTSLYATGLLDYLSKKFNEKYPNIQVSYIPVGSGEALKRAEKGDACVVLVHAPSLEKQYIQKGVITNGTIFAYNYFIIVGPPSDPAGVRNATSAVDAFRRIYEAGEAGKALFISRGDNSGTHVKELSLWKAAGLDPKGKPWYLEAGAGMDQVLIMTNEKAPEGAYTLSDIGTYLDFKAKGRLPDIEQLYASGAELINIYSIYLVSSCTGPERQAAEAFYKFIIENQDLIGAFKRDLYGVSLFNPAKGHEEELRRMWEQLAGG